ncbi:MAG: chitobiase/beta-hexosaminidase C-terminal domain-containing protein [Fuerstiella sp.]
MVAAFYPVMIQATNLAVPADGVFHDRSEISFQIQAPTSADNEPEIRYTLNGAAPTATSKLYRESVLITASTIVRAAAFVDGIQQGHGSRKKLTAVSPVENLALGKPVSSSVTSGPPFSVERVTDAGTGNLDFYLGYPAVSESLKVTIDLEAVRKVNSVTVVAYTNSRSYEKYTVEVSIDGKTFEEVGSRLQKPKQPAASVEHIFAARDVRFVRIVSEGNKGYVFDLFSKIVEVQVR